MVEILSSIRLTRRHEEQLRKLHGALRRISTDSFFPFPSDKRSEIKSKRVLLPTAASLSSENTPGDGEEREKGESRDKAEEKKTGEEKGGKGGW